MITFDIETLPTDNEQVIAALAAMVKPPETHKKQETIDAWMAENKESALAELVSKTSFDGLYGRIACIAWSVDGGEVQSTLPTDGEANSIQRFYDAIRDAAKAKYHGGTASTGLTFCGHNVAGFDLPFLKHRSIVLGIKPPPDACKAMSSKPWDNYIADTMLMWSSDSQKRASMDKLCKAFGITGKDGFDGSMVAETWPVDPHKVIEYCKDDVRRTLAIHSRLTFSECM